MTKTKTKGFGAKDPTDKMCRRLIAAWARKVLN